MQEKKGKYFFGVCRVNDKGQIVIPKQARDIYNVKPNDSLLLLGDKKGMALIKTETFYNVAEDILENK